VNRKNGEALVLSHLQNIESALAIGVVGELRQFAMLRRKELTKQRDAVANEAHALHAMGPHESSGDLKNKKDQRRVGQMRQEVVELNDKLTQLVNLEEVAKRCDSARQLTQVARRAMEPKPPEKKQRIRYETRREPMFREITVPVGVEDVT
jgi:hypothetical protein